MAYIGSNPRQIPLIKEIGVGLPVGAIVEFPLNKVSAGFLKTTGEKYNPATFPALYTVLKSDTLPFRGHDTKLGSVKWFNSRSEMDSDFVPADGQALANGFSLYPDLLLLVSTGKVPTTDDTKWKADPTMRGCFTTTTSGNEIRVPDYNGKSEGSLGAVVLRGDGKNAANLGVIQGDAIRNITGSPGFIGGSFNRAYDIGSHDQSGVFKQVNPGKHDAGLIAGSQIPNNTLGETIFDASLVVPTAPENRMVNTAGCWGVRVQVSTEFAIKAFDNITPEGLVEVAGLMQENVELKQQITDMKSANRIVPLWQGLITNETPDKQIVFSESLGNFDLVQVTYTEQTNAFISGATFPASAFINANVRLHLQQVKVDIRLEGVTATTCRAAFGGTDIGASSIRGIYGIRFLGREV